MSAEHQDFSSLSINQETSFAMAGDQQEDERLCSPQNNERREGLDEIVLDREMTIFRDHDQEPQGFSATIQEQSFGGGTLVSSDEDVDGSSGSCIESPEDYDSRVDPMEDDILQHCVNVLSRALDHVGDGDDDSICTRHFDAIDALFDSNGSLGYSASDFDFGPRYGGGGCGSPS